MHETSSTLSRYGLPTGIYRTADGLYDPMAVIEICKGLLQDFALSTEVPKGTRKALEDSPTWSFQWREKARSLDDVYKALRAFAATLPRIEDARYEVAVGKLPHAWSSPCWQNAVTLDSAPALWACTFTGGWHTASHIKVVYEVGEQTKVAQVRVSNAGLVNLKPWEGQRVSVMRTTTALLTPVVGSIDIKELEGAIHRLYLACMDCGGFVPIQEEERRSHQSGITPPHPKVSGWDLSPVVFQVPKGTSAKPGGLGGWILDNVLHAWRLDKAPPSFGNGEGPSWASFLGLSGREFVTNVSAMYLQPGDKTGPEGLERKLSSARYEAWKSSGSPKLPVDYTMAYLDMTHGIVMKDNSGATPDVSKAYIESRQYLAIPAKLPNQRVFLPYIFNSEHPRVLSRAVVGSRESLIQALNNGTATVVSVPFDCLLFQDDMQGPWNVYVNSLLPQATVQYPVVPVKAVLFEEE